MAYVRNVRKTVVGKCEGKRQLGRSRCRWEGTIKVDFKETGVSVWTGFEWLRR
jgi:hypothetical protein